MVSSINEQFFEKAEFAIRQSWEAHRQAFGPILEPSFEDSPQARIILINALNHLSRREIKRGMDLLKELRPHCENDDDMAAWTFFTGLGFEMAGSREYALQWYSEAEKFNHRFYLPYLKQAKAAHNKANFETAQKYYAIAIECLLETPESDKDEIAIGSTYTNLCSCLTMLHRYAEAEQALKEGQKYKCRPGAEAIAAILYAAMGKKEKSEVYIDKLCETVPQLVEQTQKMTLQILSGTHPAFQEGN